MTSKADILNAMQFSFFAKNPPMNTSKDGRYTITYQYAGTKEPGDLPTGSGYSGWTSFTNAEKAAFEAQLAHIESFLNVDFVEVSGRADPDMNVGKVSMSGGVLGTGGYGIRYSSQSGLEYDSFVVFKNTLDLSSRANVNTILHELGHALGLKHSFSSPTLPAAEENNKFTVMSYSDNPDNGSPSDAMMLYDVFALQDIWGSAKYNPGNTFYTGPRTNTVDVIWDSGGIDALDARGYVQGVELDLRNAHFSRFGSYDDVVMGYGTRMENAFGGSGADVINGNWLANVLKGGRGDDLIRARGGNDLVQGEAGNDRLNGQYGDDVIEGGTGNDLLYGDKGQDTLDGGSGNDTLIGAAGDDLLTGAEGWDRFLFSKGHGSDTVADFQDNIDDLRFTGFGDVNQVRSTAQQVASDVVFDFGGGDVLTVLNATISQVFDDILT